jgi:hypothetical protein
MRARMVRVWGTLAAVGVLGAGAAVLTAQQQGRPGAAQPAQTTTNTEAAIKAAEETARKEAEALKNWKPSRTAWGDPDLRGVWHLATYTPLQRPVELGEKASYTEEEAREVFKQRVEADAEVDPRTVHYDWKEYGMDGWQGGARPNLRTSLIVDPSNGRLPPRTPEADQRQAARQAAAKLRDPAAGILTFGNTYTRCILGNGAIPLVRGGNPGGEGSAAGVTAEAQFFQSPGYLTIVTQSNNDIRIIPLDGRPHVSGKVRQWYGDARGRWDGNTLVVETTNFNDRSPAQNFQGASDALQVVERFTRVGPNTLRYEYTMTDPKTWTKPWKVETEMPRVDPSVIFEFACHETNYGMMNVVKGTQLREKEAGGGRRPIRAGGE